MVGLPRPDSFIRSRDKYEITLSKSYVLLARFSDEELRKSIVGCIDSSRLRQGINAAGLDFHLSPTKGLLVSSLPGFDVNFQDEAKTFRKNCDAKTNSKGESRRIDWIVPHVNALNAFKESARGLGETLGIAVDARPVERAELWKLLKEPSANFLVMLGVETPRHSLSEFYDLFLGLGIIPVDPVLKKILTDVIALPRLKQEPLAKKLHQYAIQTGYVAPVGQATTSRFYPLGTKNIFWDDRGNAIPRYELMVVPGR